MTKPSLWRRIRNTVSRSRRKHVATIDIAPDGFVFTWRGRRSGMLWTDVSRIDAGMRDFLTFDGLYVMIFAGPSKIEVDEFDDGFRQFENELFRRWPQIREPWHRLLGTSPHEPQYETLWQR